MTPTHFSLVVVSNDTRCVSLDTISQCMTSGVAEATIPTWDGIACSFFFTMVHIAANFMNNVVEVLALLAQMTDCIYSENE